MHRQNINLPLRILRSALLEDVVGLVDVNGLERLFDLILVVGFAHSDVVCVSWANAAHHWQRGNNAGHETETESRRPVHVLVGYSSLVVSSLAPSGSP